MEENKNERPLVVEMDEAKQELLQCVNSIINVHRLPCYILSPILENVYREVQSAAQNELNIARAQMKKEETA